LRNLHEIVLNSSDDGETQAKACGYIDTKYKIAQFRF